MKRSILWFRNDQRLADNAALAAALATSQEVLPVLIMEPRQAAASPYGFSRLGDRRAQFCHEGHVDLDARLRATGSALLVRRGDPASILQELASRWGTRTVHAQRLFAWEEQQQQQAVAAVVDLRLNEANTLLHADDLPFSLERLPHVFTAFRKTVEKDFTVRHAIPEPAHIPTPQDWVDAARSDDSALYTPAPSDPRAVLRFTGGSSAAQERMAHYFGEAEHLGRYKETRNGLLGADYSSKLSPWLATGAVSAREVYHAVKHYEQQHGANESTYWLIFELLWRDFFQFSAAQHGRRIFLRNGLTGKSITATTDARRFAAWCEGRTGQPFIDANLRELLHTGWMSNRGRQNVASYLVHDLGLDWRMGASWFERMLLDYDPCSNWGNWQYVAGVGHDPRVGRRFDPVRQAAMYDADGAFVKLWT
ncbi:MAG: DASH family cryptochrome [Flavobacteriales bacterium]|nr:DASH family cryptochrome [Flavobacteriales bacterium]